MESNSFEYDNISDQEYLKLIEQQLETINGSNNQKKSKKKQEKKQDQNQRAQLNQDNNNVQMISTKNLNDLTKSSQNYQENINQNNNGQLNQINQNRQKNKGNSKINLNNEPNNIGNQPNSQQENNHQNKKKKKDEFRKNHMEFQFDSVKMIQLIKQNKDPYEFVLSNISFQANIMDIIQSYQDIKVKKIEEIQRGIYLMQVENQMDAVKIVEMGEIFIQQRQIKLYYQLNKKQSQQNVILEGIQKSKINDGIQFSKESEKYVQDRQKHEINQKSHKQQIHNSNKQNIVKQYEIKVDAQNKEPLVHEDLSSANSIQDKHQHQNDGKSIKQQQNQQKKQKQFKKEQKVDIQKKQTRDHEDLQQHRSLDIIVQNKMRPRTQMYHDERIKKLNQQMNQQNSCYKETDNFDKQRKQNNQSQQKSYHHEKNNQIKKEYQNDRLNKKKNSYRNDQYNDWSQKKIQNHHQKDKNQLQYFDKNNKNPMLYENERYYKKHQQEKNITQKITENFIQIGLKNKSLVEGTFYYNEKIPQMSYVKCPTLNPDVIFKINLFTQILKNMQQFDTSQFLFQIIFQIFKNFFIQIFKIFIQKKFYIRNKTQQKNAINGSSVICDLRQNKISKRTVQKEENIDDNESDWEDIDASEDDEDNSKNNYEKEEEVQMIPKSIIKIVKNPLEDKPEIIGKIFHKEQYFAMIDNRKIKNKPKYYDLIQDQKDISNYIFISLDRKIPAFEINKINDQVIQQIKMDSNWLQNYFSARYQGWPNHSKSPEVEIIALVGQSNDIEVECEALLRANLVYQNDFQEQTMEYLKIFENQLDDKREFIIPDLEKKIRTDLTKELICTIDPETARDLDDALSIKKIQDGIYEIGVHIADVGYFVSDKTPLDDEARLRTTSIYLIHRVIPMLPRLLCENLCSLNPGVERLAFSCFFKMKENGELVSNIKTDPPIIKKTIIKSCAKLSYGIAQKIIDGNIKSSEELQQKVNGFDCQVLIDQIKLMNKIAQNRRKIRADTGSIFFDQIKKKFVLNKENYPIGFQAEERLEANFLVEEFMLLANMFVGQIMVDACPEISLLRNHIPPQHSKASYFDSISKQFNLDIDLSNSKQVQRQLTKLLDDQNIPQTHKDIINFKLRRALEPAKYLIVDQNEPKIWHHYALNFPIYTHFTSPIRRYPDVLVHRTLEKIMMYGKNVRQHIEKERMIEIMAKCNDSKQASRKVNDGCEKIFFCLYLKSNQVITKAIVAVVNKGFVELIAAGINFEKKIEFKTLQNLIKVNKNKDNQISLHFKKKKDEIVINLNVFEEIDVQITASVSFPIDYDIKFGIMKNNSFKVCH